MSQMPFRPVPGPESGQEAVATYPTYAEAQAAVDTLSDRGFPVQHVSIVGRDLSSVETVHGRMTTARAALGGAVGGAWFGSLIGLLFLWFFTGLDWWKVLLGSIILGAVWGAILGAGAHLATGGKRDFASSQAFGAASFDVMVAAEHAGQAASILQLGATPGQQPLTRSTRAATRTERTSGDTRGQHPEH